jgi:hypothetical protein
MKKAIILLVLLLIALGSQAVSPPINDVVVSNGKTYYCEKMIMGPASVKIYNAAGEITKIPSHSVESFIKNGQVFVNMPVITKTNDTIGMAFMQYISSRWGLQLYRYCSHCLRYDPVEGIIAPINQVYRYYIFKGNKFLTLLEEKETETLLSFFGVKVLD